MKYWTWLLQNLKINPLFLFIQKFATCYLHQYASSNYSICDSKYSLLCRSIANGTTHIGRCCRKYPRMKEKWKIEIPQLQFPGDVTFFFLEFQITFASKMLGMFAWVMPLFVACSTFGSLNGAIFASSRLFFVGARNGHLPAAISLININCLTPIPSLIFMCILTLVLLFIRDIYVLINCVSYVEALFTLISISGLLWMRRTRPDAKRPIKVNILVPLTYLIICSFLVVSSCWQEPIAVLISTAIILSGIPIYYFTIARPSPWLNQISQNINLFCAKLFMCVPNEEKFDWKEKKKFLAISWLLQV